MGLCLLLLYASSTKIQWKLLELGWSQGFSAMKRTYLRHKTSNLFGLRARPNFYALFYYILTQKGNVRFHSVTTFLLLPFWYYLSVTYSYRYKICIRMFIKCLTAIKGWWFQLILFPKIIERFGKHHFASLKTFMSPNKSYLVFGNESVQVADKS